MHIPRIETLLAKSTIAQNNRNMRIPSDLGKPVSNILFQGCTEGCKGENQKLNFLA